MKRLEELDLNLLLLLHWLLTEQSVTKAAKHMGISQPAASRGLRRLRDLYKDELLVRAGRHFTRSRLAISILPQLDEAIAHLRMVARTSNEFKPREFTETVVFACNDYLATIIADVWSTAIAPHAPRATASWRPLNTEVVDALASGKVDLIFAPDMAKSNMPNTATLQDMVVKPLLDDQFVVFGSNSNSLLKADTLSIEDFVSANHILVSPEGSGSGLVNQKLQKLGLSRNIRHRCFSFLQARELALATDCLSILPERLVQTQKNGLHCSPPIKLPPIPSFAAWHSSRTSDSAHMWIRHKIFEGLASI